MSRAVVVRYRTRPDAAEENEALIRDVFAELATTRPEGFRYNTFRLDDTTFVHVAVVEGDVNPLDSSPAFAAFTVGIAQRCVEGPSPMAGRPVASYP